MKKLIKKVFSGVLIASLAISSMISLPSVGLVAHATEVDPSVVWYGDECEYTIPGTDTLLLFEKNGNGLTLVNCYRAEGHLTIPAYVEGLPVTKIDNGHVEDFGGNVFSNIYNNGNNNLTGITIPDTVKTLGTEIFAYQDDLKEVVIPNSVTSIGSGAFRNSGVRKVTLSNSLKSIPVGTFHGCHDLKEVIIPNSITKIGPSAFEDCTSLEGITLPNSITEIGTYAFAYCSSLKSIVIPNGVKKLAEGTFAHCPSLKTVTIPASVTSIQREAFGGKNVDNPSDDTYVSNINYDGTAAQWEKISKNASRQLEQTTVECGDGTKIVGNNPISTKPDDQKDDTSIKVGTTKTIGNLVYKVTSTTNTTVSVSGIAKKSLTSVSIPKTVSISGKSYKVTEIASNAFKSSKLKTVTVGANVKKIGKNAFSGSKSLVTVKGCSSVTSIESKAFYNCPKLTTIGSKSKTITLSKIKTIGDSAFQKDKAIKKVNITSTALTKIGASAFQGCTSMTSFTEKSKKLTSIGKNAFNGDKKLASITLKTTKLTSAKVGSNALKGIKSNCTIKVPSNKVKDYQKIFQSKGASKVKVTK